MTIEVRVDLVLLSLRQESLQVFLERAGGGEPRETWRLPGRALVERQSLEQAAWGCLKNTTGGADAYLEQLYTYGDPDRVPGHRTVSCVYLGLLRSDGSAPGGEIHQWHRAARLPRLMHDQGAILKYALTRLRYKLEYTAVGFELLPQTFTLTELQGAYEAVLGEDLDKRNFRRRILRAGVIEATKSHRSGEGRPARLYRYRDDAVAEVKARRLFP